MTFSSLSGVNGAYLYDGDGKRVAKGPTAGSWTKLYWYGTSSDTLVETDAGGNVTDEYIFFGGKRIARRQSSGTVNYYFSDHLGSASVVTSATGTIQDESDYYPFGGERVIVNSDPNQYKFTGKERDTESGLDFFIARYYSSGLGRFLTVDPVTMSRSLGNPQGLNKYSYSFNNPLRFIDPDGRWPLEFHRAVIADVFRDLGLTAVAAINRGSDWVDDLANQTAERSFMHSMRNGDDPNQTVERARQLALNYINTEIDAAVQLQIQHEQGGGIGYSAGALERLGHAVHTATDATSPLHEGYQPWYGWNDRNALGHRNEERRQAGSNEPAAQRARLNAFAEARAVRAQFEQRLAAAREKAAADKKKGASASKKKQKP